MSRQAYGMKSVWPGATPVAIDMSDPWNRPNRRCSLVKIQNGELLALAEPELDVFLTVDRNLSFQQDINRLDIAVVVLVAKGNRAGDICHGAVLWTCD